MSAQIAEPEVPGPKSANFFALQAAFEVRESETPLNDAGNRSIKLICFTFAGCLGAGD